MGGATGARGDDLKALKQNMGPPGEVISGHLVLSSATKWGEPWECLEEVRDADRGRELRVRSILFNFFYVESSKL